MERYQEIEKSIIKTYRKELWAKFAKAMNEYALVSPGDSVMVCISGGKDSFLMAKLFQEIIRHGKYPFEVHYVVMNPGYSEFNKNKIIENAKILNIPIEMFDSDIFNVVTSVTEGNPCYLCARMRRGYLYNKARELGCNKIALAHHFNDVIETTLLSMFFGSEVKTMMPKLHSDNFTGMELIRPLYFIREDSIISWKKYNNLTFLNCACKFTIDANEDKTLSKRKEIKALIKELSKSNPYLVNNIYKSTTNINLDTIISYTENTGKHNFIDK